MSTRRSFIRRSAQVYPDKVAVRHGRLACTYREMEAAGVFLVVVKLDLRYRKPIVYDDLVEVRTRWIGGSKIKIEHEYEVVVVERNAAICEIVAAAASSTLACVDREGAVRVLPDWLATKSA